MSNVSPILTNSFATISRLSAAICSSFNLFLADFVASPLRVLGGGTGGVVFSSLSFILLSNTLFIFRVGSILEFRFKDAEEFNDGDSGGVLKSSTAELFDLIVSDFCLCCLIAHSIGGTLAGVFFLTKKIKKCESYINVKISSLYNKMQKTFLTSK